MSNHKELTLDQKRLIAKYIAALLTAGDELRAVLKRELITTLPIKAPHDHLTYTAAQCLTTIRERLDIPVEMVDEYAPERYKRNVQQQH